MITRVCDRDRYLNEFTFHTHGWLTIRISSVGETVSKWIAYGLVEGIKISITYIDIFLIFSIINEVLWFLLIISAKEA
jgi:hypothetical protein